MSERGELGKAAPTPGSRPPGDQGTVTLWPQSPALEHAPSLTERAGPRECRGPGGEPTPASRPPGGGGHPGALRPATLFPGCGPSGERPQKPFKVDFAVLILHAGLSRLALGEAPGGTSAGRSELPATALPTPTATRFPTAWDYS